VAIRHSVTFLMTCLILFGSCSGNVGRSAASALRRSPDIARWQLFRLVTGGRPAVMLYRAILPFAAGNPVMAKTALIAALVGAAPGIISPVPLRQQLLGSKAQLQSAATPANRHFSLLHFFA
jgi:hypothetical protein